MAVEGPRQAYAAALAELHHGGQALVAGFGGAAAGAVCHGEVTDEASAADALLAAVAGAGVAVHVTANREVADRFLDDLRRLGDVDHRTGKTIPASLTAEQRRLLQLLACGASLGDAAQRLGLSRRTADRRLGQARATLGAATTAEALVEFSRRDRRAGP